MCAKGPSLCTDQEAWKIVSRINAEMADLNRELAQYNHQVEAQNEKLTVQYKKMQAMNKLIKSLYRKVADQNALLEQRVSERTEELRTTIVRLQEREEEYVQLIENIKDGIALRDENGLIILANRAFADMVEAENPAALLGVSYVDLVHPEDREGTRRRIATVTQGTPVTWREHRLLGLKGKPIWVASTGVAIWQKSGLRIMGLFHDLSEKILREAEIQYDAQSAVRVQQALLQGLDLSEHIAVRTIYRPYRYVGGDLYYFGPRSDRLLRGFLIDISGHGLSTALHTASLHVLLREVNDKNLSLPDTMRWLNQRAGEFFDEMTFAGAIAFEIDLELRMFRWVCAGIPKVWLATKERRGCVDCAGMFLGIRREETFELHSIAIDAGDSFFMMTDGISDLLQRQIGTNTVSLDFTNYETVVEQLSELADSAERRDDATAVCFHVRSLPESLIFRSSWPRILHLNGYGDYQRLRVVLSRIIAEATGQEHSLQEVAIHEALANAMECRDGVSRQHQARIKLNRFGKRLVVRVQTSRIGFAGNAQLRRLRSESETMFIYGEDASMGRGIPIMLSTAHKMTYNSEGTELLLMWNL